MNLPDYIKQVGDKTFADRFGVSERAAMSYRLQDRVPRSKLAKKIVAETPVTWEGIYAAPEKRAS
jgi:hypothetical protein